MVTRDGFDICRKVKILINEEVELIRWNDEDEDEMRNAIESDSRTVNVKRDGDNDISNPQEKAATTIQVLHLSRPLVGGVDAPDGSEEVAEVSFFFILSCGVKCID